MTIIQRRAKKNGSHNNNNGHDAHSTQPGDASPADTSSTASSDSADPFTDSSTSSTHLPRQLILERARRPSAGKGRGLSYTLKAPGTPWHELDLSEIPWLKHELADHNVPKGLTRYRRLFFVLGALLGAAIAWLMAQHVSINNLKSLVDDHISGLGLDLSEMNFSLRIPGDLADLGDSLFKTPSEFFKTRDFQVGRKLAQQGLRAEYPVILIPGVISTGLESWTTTEEASSLFRKRIWGTSTMMRTIVFEKEAWIRQISLDPDTGLDPPGGIRVRAAEGIDAASHFVAGYWIWSKVVENLAVLGYDTNNLFLASYDWRLSYHNLEVRDQYFTRLKLRIEHNKAITGKKTVLVAHSMGSSVVLYFFKWVEASGKGYGNGGPSWVEDHIEALTSIAGTFLGVPKAMAALLSGEMRDTAELPPPAAYLLERFFSRKERAQLFRTWGGSASMMIKGGNAVWGNATWAPDDADEATDTHGNIYSFRMPELAKQMGAADVEEASEEQKAASAHEESAISQAPANLTAAEAQTWLLQHTPSSFQRMMASNYSNGIEYDEAQLRENNAREVTWANPLEVSLPLAPSMKVHCIYGVGKPTERSYFYAQGPYERDEIAAEGEMGTCDDCNSTTRAAPLGFPTGRTGWIDTAVHDERSSPIVRAGCKMGEGDGTVSLLSLGAMCVEGWKRKRWNPAGIKVITHEIPHEPEAMDLRGGTTTGDHVDVLGNHRVNEAVLLVAAGRAEDVRENFVSDIRKYAAKIRWDP